MKYPTFQEEKRLWKKGYRYVVGLDEAGRGALSGPVVAAAVIFKKSKIKNQKSKLPRIAEQSSLRGRQFKIQNLRDSKKLTPKKREEFYKILTNHPQIKWGIGRVSEKVIDKINILEATKLVMIKAIKKLKRKPDFLIIDGNFKLNLPIPQKSIIKADEKVFSVALASILAKVWRDKMMLRYHKKYPQYRFDLHKGYPTRLHLKMLKKHGPCKIHRKTFKPIRKA